VTHVFLISHIQRTRLSNSVVTPSQSTET